MTILESLCACTKDTSIEGPLRYCVLDSECSEEDSEEILEILTWLLLSGFPQYVYLYQAGSLSSVPLEQVTADHAHLTREDQRLVVDHLGKLNLLPKVHFDPDFLQQHIQETCVSSEVALALSPVWKLQRSYHTSHTAAISVPSSYGQSSSYITGHQRLPVTPPSARQQSFSSLTTQDSLTLCPTSSTYTAINNLASEIWVRIPDFPDSSFCKNQYSYSLLCHGGYEDHILALTSTSVTGQPPPSLIEVPLVEGDVGTVAMDTGAPHPDEISPPSLVISRAGTADAPGWKAADLSAVKPLQKFPKPVSGSSSQPQLVGFKVTSFDHPSPPETISTVAASIPPSPVFSNTTGSSSPFLPKQLKATSCFPPPSASSIFATATIPSITPPLSQDSSRQPKLEAADPNNKKKPWSSNGTLTTNSSSSANISNNSSFSSTHSAGLKVMDPQAAIVEKIAFILAKVHKCSIHRMRSLRRSSSDSFKRKESIRRRLTGSECVKRERTESGKIRFQNVQVVETDDKLDEYDEGRYLVCDLIPKGHRYQPGYLGKTHSGRIVRNRWESFSQKKWSHFVTSNEQSFCWLTVSQMETLHNLSVLRLTGLLQQYSVGLPASREQKPSWFTSVFARRKSGAPHKQSAQCSSISPPSETFCQGEGDVLGVPIATIYQRQGDPMPKVVRDCFMNLHRNGMKSHGLFRKSGHKGRLKHIQACIMAGEELNFDDYSPYDVADMVKLFLRNIPSGGIFGSHVAHILCAIFRDFPSSCHLEATQSALLLMKDENRELLQSMLLFFSEVTKFKEANEMNEFNLGICLSMSMFPQDVVLPPVASSQAGSKGALRRKQKKPAALGTSPPGMQGVPPGLPSIQEIELQKAQSSAIAFLITHINDAFQVSRELLVTCQESLRDLSSKPPPLSQLFEGDYKARFERAFSTAIQEAADTNKAYWTQCDPVDDVQVSYKKSLDPNTLPLRTWRAVVLCNASPLDVLQAITLKRLIWDVSMSDAHVVDSLDENTDIYHKSHLSTAPHPYRDFVTLRCWRKPSVAATVSSKYAVLLEESIDFPEPVKSGAVRGRIYCSHFVMESEAEGVCRTTLILQEDTCGRLGEFYVTQYGHYAASLLAHLRDFILTTPKSKLPLVVEKGPRQHVAQQASASLPVNVVTTS